MMSSTPSKGIGRKRIWLKRIAIAGGLLLALLVALVALAIYEISKPIETKLGGNWILSEPRGLMGEPNFLPNYLQRVHGRERVTVAKSTSSTVYIGDDCVLFAVLVVEEPDLPNSKSRYEIKAACGDRKPITVAYADEFVWKHELEPDPARINGKEIPWAEIRKHAQRGESLVQP
jgi:hypothetical protein